MIRKTTLFVAALAVFALTACNENEPIAKPINSDATTTEKATDGKDYDLLKEQKEAQAAAQSNLPVTSISFSENEWDFGTINEGDNVEHVFTFTNTGSEPLVLDNCKGSCGCTVPKCPKEPIMPGGSGEIKVVFNSKGKKNNQTKRVTVTANTEPAQSILTISANVIPES